MRISYDWTKTVIKGAEYFIYGAIPAIIAYWIDANPTLSALTVGSLLKMLADYLKHKKKLGFK